MGKRERERETSFEIARYKRSDVASRVPRASALTFNERPFEFSAA